MSLRDAPVGYVPIVWNNADLFDLAPETAAETVLDEIARIGYRGDPVRPRLSRGRGAARGARASRAAPGRAVLGAGLLAGGARTRRPADARITTWHG